MEDRRLKIGFKAFGKYYFYLLETVFDFRLLSPSQDISC
jgi:hypothetical protein